MSGRLLRLVGLTAVVIVIVILGGLVFIYSGVYNIAATQPHTRPVYWVLEKAMEQSVRRRARDIKAPPLDNPALVEQGFRHYVHLCETCHGAPGVAPSGIGLGIMPAAPYLMETTRKWQPAELYWIIKYGIKMTAMPSWRPTQDEQDIWAIVAFLQKLPSLSPQGYQAMARVLEEIRSPSPASRPDPRQTPSRLDTGGCPGRQRPDPLPNPRRGRRFCIAAMACPHDPTAGRPPADHQPVFGKPDGAQPAHPVGDGPLRRPPRRHPLRGEPTVCMCFFARVPGSAKAA